MTSSIGKTVATRIQRLRRLPETALGWWVAALLVAVLVILPLFFVKIPPLLDYPNHLARMYVLAFAAKDPVLSRFYAARWGIIPDLGIDVVMPTMLRVMPVYLAGRVMLGVVLLLPLAGAVAYSRAAFGTRSYWPLGAGMISYNALFFLGFLNFQLSLGLALLAAALWLAWGERHSVAGTLAEAVCATLVFFCHIFGLLFLIVLIGARELAGLWQWRGGGGPILRRALLRTAMMAGIFAVPAFLYLQTPLFDKAEHLTWQPTVFLWLTNKLRLLAAPFWAYRPRITILTAGIVLGLTYVLIRDRLLKLPRGSGIACIGLLLIYLALPFGIKGATYVYVRAAIMLGLVLFAGCAPRLRPRAALAVAGLLAALLLVRIGSITQVWHNYNKEIVAFETTIAPVEPGARVLAVGAPLEADPTYWRNLPPGHVLSDDVLDLHLPALLVIERKAFWPLLFADPAQHPMRVRPPYAKLAGKGWPPDYRSLITHRPAPGDWPAPYLLNWERDFDYVLLLDPDAAGDLTKLLPGRLHLVSRSALAALFRIRKPALAP